MKYLFAFLFLIGPLYQSSAQYHYVKQWDKRFGGNRSDNVYSLKITVDKGFILSGASRSAVSGDKTQQNWDTTYASSDVWIVKVDSSGNKEWDKRFGGLNQDFSFQVVQAQDNGYAISAYTSSGLIGDLTQPSRGNIDYWLIKTDSLGDKQWDRRFGGSGREELWGIQQTLDRGYILGGSSFSSISGDKTEPNWGGCDYWVVKTDSIGNKMWDKRFGGDNYDYMFDIVQASDGGYLLGGYSYSNISGDKSQSNWDWLHANMWIVKIDASGNKQWDKRFGGVRGETFHALLQTSDNGFVLAGMSYSDISGDKTQVGNNGSADYWIVKIDSAGSKLWDKGYGGNDEDDLKRVSLTTDGGYLLSGNSRSDASGSKTESNTGDLQSWIVKLDSVGNKQWDKTIHVNGNNSIANAVQTHDGCYLVASTCGAEIGGEKSMASIDSSADYWILKFCMEQYNSIDPGTERQEPSQLQVWPNPFTSDLSIALTGEHVANATFTITSLMGQVVYQQTETNLATGYTKMLDLSYLPGGVYFVAVNTGERTVVERVVKSSE
ncbi:MAG TPA: T9SS type A sorting domain-containing protein [Chitinophagales bacterium]|nr:T9SS type A sorting domain-containing protein [Chitinophagales bacterium]